ncbi:putative transcriptional regulator [Allocatelliglobosispora scoriae]|uniref:Putative transcriptional regulator n=1 Tax=Allocatelliglobosispora scoriae TaxID=643052 RepID=A0A841C1U3_9ACTN|nr:BlaI/MecI/CopY family transcriptional regulator [Allocatelliglobosispora scoriae]MBB5874324.1 putative transcriptional regulator [Allocatelliglobosispora scoriae]
MSDADRRRRAAGSLEAQVMAVLWAASAPMTPAEVNAQVGADLAYNTVQTILSRLADKHLVQRAPRGRAHVYWPTRDEAAAAAEKLRATLSGVGDREQVLQQFAASLDDQEAELLRKMLRDRGARS